VLREVEADIERLKAWSDDLTAKRKAKQRQREAMLERLHVAMDILGVDRIEGEASAFVLQNSTPKVDIEDADSLSAEFVDIVPATSKPNKAAIAKALKRGEDIPGATLIRGRHVRRTL